MGDAVSVSAVSVVGRAGRQGAVGHSRRKSCWVRVIEFIGSCLWDMGRGCGWYLFW